jgi:hypothetical protein
MGSAHQAGDHGRIAETYSVARTQDVESCPRVELGVCECENVGCQRSMQLLVFELEPTTCSPDLGKLCDFECFWFLCNPASMHHTWQPPNSGIRTSVAMSREVCSQV